MRNDDEIVFEGKQHLVIPTPVPAQVPAGIFPVGAYKVIESDELEAAVGWHLVAVLPAAIPLRVRHEQRDKYGGPLGRHEYPVFVPGHRFLVVLPEGSALARMQDRLDDAVRSARFSEEETSAAKSAVTTLKAQAADLETRLGVAERARDNARETLQKVQLQAQRGEEALAERTRHVRVLREALGTIQADKLIAESDESAR